MVTVPRWLLPGELADGWPVHRRTARDWAADAALFAFAAALWVENTRNFPPEGVDFIPDWMIAVNPWAGAAACVALWWRRQVPLALAAVLVGVLLVSGAALGAAMVATLTVSVHRPPLRAAAVTGAYLLTVAYYALLSRPPGVDRPVLVASTALMFVVPFCVGTAVRARRMVVLGLRREHALHLAQVRTAERAGLAREMHDVLAHRISLLTVHAGALAYRTARAAARDGPPLDAAEVGQAAEVIQDNARRALEELTEVLAVLRTPGTTSEPGALLDDLPRLVAEAEAAGQRVRLDADVDAAGLRPQVQRTVYRLVQEGLTNARKHAPGSTVTVRLDGEPGGTLTVTVGNPVDGARQPGPSGNGLAGLAERVGLDGGSIEYGPVDGQFRLTARLPWRRP